MLVSTELWNLTCISLWNWRSSYLADTLVMMTIMVGDMDMIIMEVVMGMMIIMEVGMDMIIIMVVGMDTMIIMMLAGMDMMITQVEVMTIIEEVQNIQPTTKIVKMKS